MQYSTPYIFHDSLLSLPASFPYQVFFSIRKPVFGRYFFSISSCNVSNDNPTNDNEMEGNYHPISRAHSCSNESEKTSLWSRRHIHLTLIAETRVTNDAAVRIDGTVIGVDR